MQKEINALWREARDVEFAIGRQIIAASDVVLVTHEESPKP